MNGYRKQGLLTSEAGETGSQIGFIAGAVVAVAAAYFTGGTSIYGYLMLASVGGAVGSMVGGILDPVKKKEESSNVPQSGIKDFYVTSAALGQMIPVLYGTYRMPGNIIQAGIKEPRQITNTTDPDGPGGLPPVIVGVAGGAVPGIMSKGKGGGEDVQITSVTVYSITMAVGLCEGPILAVGRIWTDLDLFYDPSSDLGHLRYSHEDSNAIYFSGVNKSVTEMVVYKGTEEQSPDGYLMDLVHWAPDSVPAYRGLAYAVLADFDLGASGRVPNFTFEVVKERGATERPVDLALIDGGYGLYVLHTKDMQPQARSVYFGGLYVHLRMEGIFLEGPDEDRVWAQMGFGLGDIIVIEGALLETNNRTARVTDLPAEFPNYMATDGEFIEDHNQVDIRLNLPPLHTKDRQGVMRSYGAPRLTEMTGAARLAGIFPLSIATASGAGSTNSLVAVLVSGTQDDVSGEPMDSIWLFASGGNLQDIYGGPQALRTPEEIAAGTRLGLGPMASDDNHFFYVCLENLNALTLYDVEAQTFFRAGLESTPRRVVWSPLGGGSGQVYVLRDGDWVTRLEGGTGLGVIDQIQVGAGSAFGRMIRASDDRIWVSAQDADRLYYFTTAGDVDSVELPMRLPCYLVEARDTSIWAASFDRGEIVRVDSTTYDVEHFDLPDTMTSLAPAQGGRIWAVSSMTRSAIYLIETDGSYTMLTLPYGAQKVVADTSGEPSRDGYAYVICTDGNTVVSVAPDCSRFQTVDSGAGLARCVQDLSRRAGLPPDRIDTSGLLNTQVNFILSEVASAKDTLSLLGETYNFRWVETEGYVRYFYNYAVPTLATIAENVLAGGIDKEDTKSLGVSRLQERELPTKVSISYTSAERNYQDRSETVQLTSGNVEQNPHVYRYPFAMKPEEAYQLAEIRLFEPWAQRERAEFTLPPLFMLLDPGDAVDVSARDIRYNIRLSEITRARTWLHTVRGQSTYPPLFLDPAVATEALALKAVGLRSKGTQGSLRAAGGVPVQASIYQDTVPKPGVSYPFRSPTVPGLVLAQPGTGIITLQNPSRMAVILIEPPALTPTDIVLRAYLGTYRTQPERDFSAMSLYRSQNGLIDFTYVAADATESTAGEALTALPTVANPFVWDFVNTVDIKMRAGTLRMVSQLDVLNGTNRAMLGKELIQFARATLTAPGVYRLSQLLRGRLGTEAFVGTHTVGEGLVLLDGNTVRDTYLFERQIVETTYYYRVIDATTGLSSAASFAQVMYGNALKPWAPVLKGVVRDDTPLEDDVRLTWLYRARLSPDLVDYSGVAWDIDFTRQFHVRIYADASYAVVRNTYFTEVFTGSAEVLLTYTYTAAQQLTDFGSVQATIYYGIVPIGAQNVLGYEARGSG